MAGIFISYRRADSAAEAGRLYDRLVLRFGQLSVFKDVDAIPPGVLFDSYIQNSLRQSSVCLVLIGPHWLSSASERGLRRLDDPSDRVRIEIEQAFALGLTVIPVLLDETPMPIANNLPLSIVDLTRVQAIRLRNDPDFSHDVSRLTAAIERAFQTSSPVSGTPVSHADQFPSQSEQSPLLTQTTPPSAVPVQKPSASNVPSQSAGTYLLPSEARNGYLVIGASGIVILIAYFVLPYVSGGDLSATLFHTTAAELTSEYSVLSIVFIAAILASIIGVFSAFRGLAHGQQILRIGSLAAIGVGVVGIVALITQLVQYSQELLTPGSASWNAYISNGFVLNALPQARVSIGFVTIGLGLLAIIFGGYRSFVKHNL